MFKRIFTIVFPLTVICSIAWILVSEAAQLQPITTSVICSAPANCATANLNLEAATLRRPTTNVLGRAHIGILVMHPNSRYINNAVCAPLAQRGFTVLCTNSEFSGRDLEYYGYEQHAPGMRSSINYLKSIAATLAQPAVTKVVLLGFSMGAPLMLYYQNIAENGPGACQGPEKIIPCDDTNLHNLPKADGVILRDAHLGDALSTFTNVDPAIHNNACEPRNPAFDMFAEANGYNLATDGATYSKQFNKTYTTHQSIRNEDIIHEALGLLRKEIKATGDPSQLGEDIPFTVIGSQNARLWQPDISLLKYTKRAHTLLARDGTRPVQIIQSVRVPAGERDTALDCVDSSIAANVRVWLGAHALRSTPGKYTQTEDDITGIDWDSSATSSITNVRGIKVPLVIVAHTAHYFIRPDEIIYDTATTLDKTIAFNEGAVHGGGPCAPCALQIDPTLTPAQANAYFGDTQARESDFFAEWLAARY
jgi:hypothetical protein